MLKIYYIVFVNQRWKQEEDRTGGEDINAEPNEWCWS